MVFLTDDYLVANFTSVLTTPLLILILLRTQIRNRSDSSVILLLLTYNSGIIFHPRTPYRNLYEPLVYFVKAVFIKTRSDNP